MKGYTLDFKIRKWPKKVVGYIGTTLLILLIGVCVALACGYLMGFKIIRIKGKSMEPFIHYGNIIVVRKVYSQDELKVGDVITFTKDVKKNSGYTTHRIYSITGDEIVTKGDPNVSTDPGHITLENVVGQLVYNFDVLDEVLVYIVTLSNIATLLMFVLIIYQLGVFYLAQGPFYWLRLLSPYYRKIDK